MPLRSGQVRAAWALCAVTFPARSDIPSSVCLAPHGQNPPKVSSRYAANPLPMPAPIPVPPDLLVLTLAPKNTAANRMNANTAQTQLPPSRADIRVCFQIALVSKTKIPVANANDTAVPSNKLKSVPRRNPALPTRRDRKNGQLPCPPEMNIAEARMSTKLKTCPRFFIHCAPACCQEGSGKGIPDAPPLAEEPTSASKIWGAYLAVRGDSSAMKMPTPQSSHKLGECTSLPTSTLVMAGNPVNWVVLDCSLIGSSREIFVGILERFFARAYLRGGKILLHPLLEAFDLLGCNTHRKSALPVAGGLL